jgi:hypothetical protein
MLPGRLVLPGAYTLRECNRGGDQAFDVNARDVRVREPVADWRRQRLYPVFSGTIDEVRVWYNVALTQAQI